MIVAESDPLVVAMHLTELQVPLLLQVLGSCPLCEIAMTDFAKTTSTVVVQRKRRVCELQRLLLDQTELALSEVESEGLQ